VSNFVDDQQFEGYETNEKYILVEAVASVVIIWRVVLKMPKLLLHSMWQMVLHNIEANQRANVTPIIFINCAHRAKFSLSNLIPYVWMPSNLDTHIESKCCNIYKQSLRKKVVLVKCITYMTWLKAVHAVGVVCVASSWVSMDPCNVGPKIPDSGQANIAVIWQILQHSVKSK
jgi:hypothetical protein